MYKIIPLLLSACLLTACKHDNPLQTHTKKQSAEFLMQASANVEKRLHFAIKKGDEGYGYLECMEGRNNPEIQCDDLIRGIVSFAKEGHFKGFESLTYKDATDQAVFESLGDDYAEIMLATEPVFYPKG